MSKRTVALALGVVLLCAFATGAAERKEIPEKYTWNIADVYPSQEAWAEAKAKLEKDVACMEAFRGRLGDSPQTLLKATITLETFQKELTRVYLYASMTMDVDTRDSASQAMIQSVQKLASDFSPTVAYLEPEILEVGEAKIAEFLKAEPGLQPYKPVFDEILRAKPHTLSSAEEKVAARFGSVMGTGSAVYGIFTNADMPFPEVTLASGEKVRIDQSAYSKYRASENRADRDLVFREFWKTYDGYKRTLGMTLFNQVKAHTVTQELRNYDSCLAAALFGNNVPVTVYKQLITDVNANLPTLHRYLKLRQKMMGVDQLRYEDLYAPIVKAVEMKFTPEEAQAATLEAMAPLGPDYTSVLKRCFESRWIDFMPSTGKRSGAYSTGAGYDVHPFQLLNFNGAYDDVSTLAHESGHSMHSWYSNKNQKFLNAHYSIFVAEVASTLNENLLFHATMAKAKDDETKLYLLGERLDGYRQTLFRQTLFAEFEMRIHEMAENGQPLTGDSLTALYLELVRRYYGHDAGVCTIDPLYGVEWSFIPHFYRNFYVYQYATSLVASTTLADAIRKEHAAGKTGARDAYIRALSAGSTLPPIDILKGAGVDMTTSAPFATAMKEMNAIMDQIEAILAKKKV